MSRSNDNRSGPVAGQSGAAPYSTTYATATGDTEVGPDPQSLAVVRFGTAPATRGDPREWYVPLTQLGERETVEVWRSAQPVEHGWDGDVGYALNGDVMLAQLAVDESRYAGLEQAAFAVYERLLSFVAARGYPFPIRVWNYVSGINEGSGDDERYKRFNAGRSKAFGSRDGFEPSYPAASAIGSAEPGLRIHLIAARQESVPIENPRQRSAFRYPPLYGRPSPSFCRARLVCWPRERHLYLSGTASVVGHETLHAGDCISQLHETLRNIGSLLSGMALAEPPLAEIGWADLKLLRVYLRDRDDFSRVQAALADHVGEQPSMLCVLGDICRRDLALEIEGLFVSVA